MLPALLATLAAAVPTVDCRTHIETAEAPADQRRRAVAQSLHHDGTIFWGLRNAVDHPFTGKHPHLTYKSAISVRAGAPLTIKIAAADRGWIALDYKRQNERQRPPTLAKGEPVTRLVPCPPETKRFSDGEPIGRETAWSGGFIVLRPGCATLLLRRKGEEQWSELRAGFGERC